MEIINWFISLTPMQWFALVCAVAVPAFFLSVLRLVIKHDAWIN